MHEATLMSRIRLDGDYCRGWTFCEGKGFLMVALARGYLNFKLLYIGIGFIVSCVHCEVQSRAMT